MSLKYLKNRRFYQFYWPSSGCLKNGIKMVDLLLVIMTYRGVITTRRVNNVQMRVREMRFWSAVMLRTCTLRYLLTRRCGSGKIVK